MPRQPQRLIIPRWVPAAARRMIQGIWQYWTLDEAARAALVRFATYPAMRTEVWEKLPAEPESAAGDVIYYAAIAVMVFPMLRPFPTTGRRAALDRWAQFRRKHPEPPSNNSYAFSAYELLKAVCDMRDDLWAQHFQGLDREHVISILGATAMSFISMAKDHEAWFAAMQFPKVRQWDHPRAAELFFSRWMSSRLKAIYGRDCDFVVSALTAVAFDRVDVGEETVRWRRRTDRKKRSD
jgi:hypothetical protein